MPYGILLPGGSELLLGVQNTRDAAASGAGQLGATGTRVAARTADARGAGQLGSTWTQGDQTRTADSRGAGQLAAARLRKATRSGDARGAGALAASWKRLWAVDARGTATLFSAYEVTALDHPVPGPEHRYRTIEQLAARFRRSWSECPVVHAGEADTFDRATPLWLRWNVFLAPPVALEGWTSFGTLIIEQYAPGGESDTEMRQRGARIDTLLRSLSPTAGVRFSSYEFRSIGSDRAWWHSNLIFQFEHETAL